MQTGVQQQDNAQPTRQCVRLLARLQAMNMTASQILSTYLRVEDTH